MLISPNQLNRHLTDPAWIVFDCRHDLLDAQRGARVYAEGHLPGAYFVPVETVLAGEKTGRNGRHPLPAPGAFAAFLNHHGLMPNTQIVAYDDAGGQYAARLWWLARWIGLTKVAVLDGGLGKWSAEGYATDNVVPAPRLGGTVVARPYSARLKSATDLLANLESRTCLVLDARAAERYRGETEPVDPVAGHIPGASNRFFKANLNADLTMRPAEELRREFKALLGAWRPDQVVHQCGSGVTACANLLAMEHAGLTGSKLYPGSWSEWVADPTRPVARG
jgi:thiosulfate/3-mercaptopyruvate sulfurtransferase